MEILDVSQVNKVVDYLVSGGIVALPTDTIYGFSCFATDNNAIDKLCKMKHRDDGKQFILLVSKSLDLSKIIVLNDKIKDFIHKYTPANLTMIVNKNDNIKLANIFELPTLAIRIPDNEFLQAVLDRVGFMVSTSCNVQGEPYLNDFTAIMTAFPLIDAVVKDKSNIAVPSTIVDLTGKYIKVVRQGDFIIR